jgi:hypothetical protein
VFNCDTFAKYAYNGKNIDKHFVKKISINNTMEIVNKRKLLKGSVQGEEKKTLAFFSHDGIH